MNDNQDKLDEQLLNIVLSENSDVEVKLKKAKYLVELGANVNGQVFGKSILVWAKKNEDIEQEIIEFLEEKGATESEISKEEANELKKQFWDEDGKFKNVEEIKTLVKKGANLGDEYYWEMGAWDYIYDVMVWKSLKFDEMNEILKILPKGYEIDGSVNLSGCNFEKLPDFSRVKVLDEFNCSENLFTTLKGAPKEVKCFVCRDNQLTSLEGGPEEVGWSFDCSGNELTSLEGAPKVVVWNFECHNNKLNTLKGAPERVGGCFNCQNNKLTTLEWAPKEVESFNCANNWLISLRGAPSEVKGYFCCSGNQLTSLEWAPERVGNSFECLNNKLETLKGKPKIIGGAFVIEDDVRKRILGKAVGNFFKNIFGGNEGR